MIHEKDNARTLFFARLKREGRYADFQARIKAKEEETGKTYLSLMLGVMKEMGYVSQNDERTRADQYELTKPETEGEERAQVSLSSEAARFERAVAALPKKAKEKDIMEWINCHPAMLRAARTGSATVLGIDDIRRAPSQGAVNQLQHWSNHQDAFHVKYLEIKKKEIQGAEDEPDSIKNADPTLAECEILLREVEGALAVAV